MKEWPSLNIFFKVFNITVLSLVTGFGLNVVWLLCFLLAMFCVHQWWSIIVNSQWASEILLTLLLNFIVLIDKGQNSNPKTVQFVQYMNIYKCLSSNIFHHLTGQHFTKPLHHSLLFSFDCCLFSTFHHFISFSIRSENVFNIKPINLFDSTV